MCKLFVIAKFNILLLKTKNPDNIVLKWKIVKKRKKEKKQLITLISYTSTDATVDASDYKIRN